MKKRHMKKYIPKGTEYCGSCKNRVKIGLRTEEGIYNQEPYKETFMAIRCRFTGVDNFNNFDIGFIDRCKVCNIGRVSTKNELLQYPKQLKLKIKKFCFYN